MFRAFLFLLSITASAAAVSSFTDKDLAQLLQDSRKNHEKIIIYTWSPHMVLSQKGLDEAFKFQNGYQHVILLDPNSNRELARKMAAKNRWPESVLRLNASRLLIEKGVRVHYPSYVFVQNGRMTSPLIPGYKDPREMEILEKRYFK